MYIHLPPCSRGSTAENDRRLRTTTPHCGTSRRHRLVVSPGHLPLLLYPCPRPTEPSPCTSRTGNALVHCPCPPSDPSLLHCICPSRVAHRRSSRNPRLLCAYYTILQNAPPAVVVRRLFLPAGGVDARTSPLTHLRCMKTSAAARKPRLQDDVYRQKAARGRACRLAWARFRWDRAAPVHISHLFHIQAPSVLDWQIFCWKKLDDKETQHPSHIISIKIFFGPSRRSNRHI